MRELVYSCQVYGRGEQGFPVARSEASTMSTLAWTYEENIKEV